MIENITRKTDSYKPITRDEAEWLFANASNAELSKIATTVKNRFHTKNSASYLIMAIINYTNICVAGCDYCAFYRYPHEEGAYLKNLDEMRPNIDKVISLGGRLVAFNGGFHPKMDIRDYAKLFEEIHCFYPKITFFEMTVAEFLFSCKISKVSLKDGARILKSAGTQWITGGGAEILDNDFRRRHSPGKFSVEEFYEAQRAILSAQIGSTATMVIGFDESLEERFNHLESLRVFQDGLEGTKLASFLCWTYKPYNTKIGGKEISTEEYLRWLAICRIYLDNFLHIRTSVLTKNTDALIGLKYGANDFDLPVEDEVTQKAGAKISLEFENILEFARKSGFKLEYRDPLKFDCGCGPLRNIKH